MDEQQRKNKKLLLTILGVAVVIVALVGVTYAFFNYTREGGSNTVKTGRLYFTSSYTEVNLTNAFPIDSQSASSENNPNVATININVVGDTDYARGLEYLVTAEDVHMTIGEGQNARRVPLALEVGVTNNQESNPAVYLGEIETGDYYTARNSYQGNGVSKYKVVYNEPLEEGSRILVGYIAPNTTQGEASGIDGVITIKAYFDATKIAITDTYNETTPETAEYGTTTNWVNNRTVFTTSEWNSIQQSGKELSFKIKVEANEGIWVPNPGSAPMTIDKSNESDSMVPTTTRTIEITPNGDGAITCTSSNTSVATCEITDTNDEEPLNGDILGDVVATKYAKIRAVGEGSAVITVRQAAGKEYATEKVLTYNVTVAKLSTTMSLNKSSGTIIMGDSDNITITTNGDGVLSCTSSTAHAICSIENGVLTITGISEGPAVITVSQGEGTTHLTATDVIYTATINKHGSTLTLEENTIDLTYNGTNGENSYSYNGDGTVTCLSSDTTKVTCTVDTANNKVVLSPVGATSTAVTITVSATATPNYYAPTDATFTVNVEKAIGYIALSEASGSYTYGESKTFTVTSNSGSISTDKCEIDGTTITCSGFNVGNETVTVTSVANNNYTAAETTYSLTINKATLTCPGTGGAETNKTFNNATQTYDGNSCPTGSSRTSASGKDVGTYYSTCTADGNHEFSSACNAGKMVIEQAEATCPTISGSTNTYNGSSRTITVSGGANGEIQYSTDNSTWSTTKPTRTAAGTTTVYVRIYATGNYKTKTCGSANIVINKAAASFSCSNKNYTGSSQTGCTCTNCTLGTGCSATDAGSYTCNATANANYTLTTTSIGWTMNKATGWITINTKPSSVSCGGTTTVTVNGSHGGTISCSSNNTSYVTCSGTTITGKAAGSATVTCTSAATTNYNAASTSWTVTTGACASWHYFNNYNNANNCFKYSNKCPNNCQSLYGTSTWSCVGSDSTAPSSASLASGGYCWCYY